MAYGQDYCSEAFSNISSIIDARFLKRTEFFGFQGSVLKENNAFIRAVRANDFNELTFFRVENRMMKELNDSILKDKGESYSVSISFQEIFLKELRESEPEIYKRAALRYHDYKSLNLGIRALGDRRPIEEAYHRANQKFAAELEAALAEKGVLVPEHAANLERWMIGGFGASPDKASLVTKLSRDGASRVKRFSEIASEYQELLLKKKKNWQEIQDISEEGIFKTWKDGERTLDLDVINLARKSTSKKEFAKDATIIFPGLKRKDAQLIYDYIETIDKFTASVLTPGTVSLSPNSTTGIVYSVDIGQMGAEGLMETMKSINRLDGIDDVLIASREAFWKADKKLASFYEHVERGFGSDLEFSLAQKASHTSGDDALFVFDDALDYLKKREASLLKNGGPSDELSSVRKAISDYQNKWKDYRESGFDNYFRRVTDHPEANRLRVTAIKPKYEGTGELVKRSELSSLIEMAEGAEKYIRKALLKEASIGPEKASKIMIGIETTPINANSLRHRIVVRNGSGASSSRLEELIGKHYQSYLNEGQHLKSFLSPRIQTLN